MAHRRLSSAEKGKGLDFEHQEPARATRVKVPLPDNSDLLRKHSLTLIGRVTNKTAQKVWSLIPFFTEHWKTEFKPVGSDLGNGLFQFQFELESDLLAVLDQRPYHYARWMVILQRWEPTTSPRFPSLIPFWIKVQGLPVHLWTEPTIRCIGGNIGQYEKAEISALSARMRVHIDGLLPLIKSTIVEYPNGDEVSATLVYERLDKHCTKCLRLDHELNECLVARAEEKAKKAAQEKADEAAGSTVCKEKEPNRDSQSHPANMQRNEGFRFSATNRETSQSRGYTKEGRDYAHHRKPKYQSKIWHERSSLRQSSQARERAKFKNMRFTRTSREHSNFRQIPEPQTRSYYREVSRRTPENIETVSSASKIHQEASDRGNPLQTTPAYIPDEVLNEARAELRDYMIQYTKSADPTEREARKERFRKAEEQGEMEEAAIQMAKTSMSISADRKRRALDEATPERVPATQRLGSSSQQKSVSREENSHELMLNSQERLPVSLRVGPAIPQNTNQEETETFHDTNSSERIPATQRLGPPLASPTDRTKDPEAAIPKRKPGRPPGRKAQEKILQEHGAVQKRRTVAQKKNSPGRRKTSPKTTAPARLKSKTGTSRGGEHAYSATSSDNQPIVNMIPATVKKRMDFRIPSDRGP